MKPGAFRAIWQQACMVVLWLGGLTLGAAIVMLALTVLGSA